MDDLALCQKVADIEGLITSVLGGNLMRVIPLNSGTTQSPYNPVYDDGICWRLMHKHSIKISRNGSGEYVAMYTHCRGEEDINPNRALLKAIIEKHEQRLT